MLQLLARADGGPTGLAAEDARRLRASTRILVGARSRAAAHGPAAAEVISSFDPEVTLQYWEWNRVSILAIEQLRKFGVSDAGWDQFSLERRQLVRRRAMIQEVTTQRLSTRLQEAGIRAVSLKGPTLGRRLYGSVDVRDGSADIDLLVHRSQLAAAASVAVELGWAAQDDGDLADGLPDLHRSFAGPVPEVALDLHWRIERHAGNAFAEHVLNRAIENRGVWVPDDGSLAACLLSYWNRDGLHRMRYAADIAAWISQYPRFDAESFPGSMTPMLSLTLDAATAVTGIEAALASPLLPRESRLASATVRIAERDKLQSVYSERGQIAVVAVASAERGHRVHQLRDIWRNAGTHRLTARMRRSRVLVGIVRAASCTRIAINAVRLLSRGR